MNNKSLNLVAGTNINLTKSLENNSVTVNCIGTGPSVTNENIIIYDIYQDNEAESGMAGLPDAETLISKIKHEGATVMLRYAWTFYTNTGIYLYYLSDFHEAINTYNMTFTRIQEGNTDSNIVVDFIKCSVTNSGGTYTATWTKDDITIETDQSNIPIVYGFYDEDTSSLPQGAIWDNATDINRNVMILQHSSEHRTSLENIFYLDEISFGSGSTIIIRFINSRRNKILYTMQYSGHWSDWELVDGGDFYNTKEVSITEEEESVASHIPTENTINEVFPKRFVDKYIDFPEIRYNFENGNDHGTIIFRKTEINDDNDVIYYTSIPDHMGRFYVVKGYMEGLSHFTGDTKITSWELGAKRQISYTDI